MSTRLGKSFHSIMSERETVEFLYGKYIKENYSEKKFKFIKGVKGLSKKEQKVKEEFELRALREGNSFQ